MDTFSTTYHPQVRRGPGAFIRDWLVSVRDWLDARGRGAWIAAMILAFVFVWPVGLGILAYMIWSKRMSCHHRNRRAFRHGMTGNAAFDAYREETLKRLEEERDEFLTFLQQLREAKDKVEFDQFMAGRNKT